MSQFTPANIVWVQPDPSRQDNIWVMQHCQALDQACVAQNEQDVLPDSKQVQANAVQAPNKSQYAHPIDLKPLEGIANPITNQPMSPRQPPGCPKPGEKKEHEAPQWIPSNNSVALEMMRKRWGPGFGQDNSWGKWTGSESATYLPGIYNAAGHLIRQSWMASDDVESMVAFAARDANFPCFVPDCPPWSVDSPDVQARPDQVEKLRKAYGVCFITHHINHYCALFVNQITGRSFWYDSLWKGGDSTLRFALDMDRLCKFYKSAGAHHNLIRVIRRRAGVVIGPQQTDEWTCGLHAAEFLRCCIRDNVTNISAAPTWSGWNPRRGTIAAQLNIQWRQWILQEFSPPGNYGKKELRPKPRLIQDTYDQRLRQQGNRSPDQGDAIEVKTQKPSEPVPERKASPPPFGPTPLPERPVPRTLGDTRHFVEHQWDILVGLRKASKVKPKVDMKDLENILALTHVAFYPWVKSQLEHLFAQLPPELKADIPRPDQVDSSQKTSSRQSSPWRLGQEESSPKPQQTAPSPPKFPPPPASSQSPERHDKDYTNLISAFERLCSQRESQGTMIGIKDIERVLVTVSQQDQTQVRNILVRQAQDTNLRIRRSESAPPPSDQAPKRPPSSPKEKQIEQPQPQAPKDPEIFKTLTNVAQTMYRKAEGQRHALAVTLANTERQRASLKKQKSKGILYHTRDDYISMFPSPYELAAKEMKPWNLFLLPTMAPGWEGHTRYEQGLVWDQAFDEAQQEAEREEERNQPSKSGYGLRRRK